MLGHRTFGFYTPTQLEEQANLAWFDSHKVVNGGEFDRQIRNNPEFTPLHVVEKENIYDMELRKFLSLRLRKDIYDPTQIAIAVHLLQVPDKLLQYVPSTIIAKNTEYNKVTGVDESMFASGKDMRDVNAWCAAAYGLITPLQYQAYLDHQSDKRGIYKGYYSNTELPIPTNDDLKTHYMPLGYKDPLGNEIEWSMEEMFHRTVSFVLATRLPKEPRSPMVLTKSLANHFWERTTFLAVSGELPMEAIDLVRFKNSDFGATQEDFTKRRLLHHLFDTYWFVEY